MTSNATADPTTLRDASYAALRCRAVTDNAHVLVSALYERVTTHEKTTGKRKNARVKKADAHKKAIEGFVGDLLLAQTREKGGGWVYRSTRRESFTGDAVSYRQFKRLLDSLVDSNLIEMKKGFQPRTKFSDSEGGGSMASRSWAPRFRANQALLKLAEQNGVYPSDAMQHFIKELPKDPLQVRARSVREDGRKVRGALIKWRKEFNAKVRQRGEKLEAEVKELNEFLDKADIRGGIHRGYVRVFNNGDDPTFFWSLGGRLYSGDDSYQHVQRSERLRMTLNDEPVCEIDIRASYLTIYHAIHRAKLDLTNDPYVLPKLGQNARAAVKAWFVTTFGSPKHISRWPKDTKKDYREETGRDLSEYPIKTIREEVSPEWRAWIGRGPSAARLIGSNFLKMVSATKNTEVSKKVAFNENEQGSGDDLCPLWSKSGQKRGRSVCPLSARSGLMHCSKMYLYSIISSARASSAGDYARTTDPCPLRVIRDRSNQRSRRPMSAMPPIATGFRGAAK
jgi:hypothetical protein